MIERGTALTKELKNVYGIKTVHDKSVYDMVDEVTAMPLITLQVIVWRRHLGKILR